MDFTEKTISGERIYSGKVIKVDVEEVGLPNGKTSKRELVRHPGAVAVIAVTQDHNIVMVRQYRKALEKEILEIPAGKMEEGEEPHITAGRELEEETGYKPLSLKKIASFYTAPGFCDELVHLYEADIDKPGTPFTDEDEFVQVKEISLEEAEDAIEKNLIHDAKTMYAVQYLKLRINKE